MSARKSRTHGRRGGGQPDHDGDADTTDLGRAQRRSDGREVNLMIEETRSLDITFLEYNDSVCVPLP